MSLAEQDSRLLDEFSDALWLEDGLSRNTLESYRSDLAQLGAWLAKRQPASGSLGFLATATRADLLEFLAHRVAGRIKASTTSREL
jgi:integrase/recombinase XerD